MLECRIGCCLQWCVWMWCLAGSQMLCVSVICRALQRRSMKWAVVASSTPPPVWLVTEPCLPVSHDWSVADLLLKVIVLINCPLPPSLMECSLKIKCLVVRLAVPTCTPSHFLLGWKYSLKSAKIDFSLQLFCEAMVLIYYMKEWSQF